jgi:hypothetical protein
MWFGTKSSMSLKAALGAAVRGAGKRGVATDSRCVV